LGWCSTTSEEEGVKDAQGLKVKDFPNRDIKRSRSKVSIFVVGEPETQSKR